MFSIVKVDEGPPGHDAVILIVQILEGKTNNGKILWGSYDVSQKCEHVFHWCFGILLDFPV
jgi:hypothetical protein